MSTLSIIVPCYNEQESIPLFFNAVEKVVSKMEPEIEYWFVDDGSIDNSFKEMRKLHNHYPKRVHYITFRNILFKIISILLLFVFVRHSGDYLKCLNFKNKLATGLK